ncbi:D123-domain-containing protein [Entophlyctis helioformis]|nr:D123-domain-containing protein [Entophlyctis helioformis]
MPAVDEISALLSSASIDDAVEAAAPETGSHRFPGFTVQHVDNCAFSSWYPSFSAVTLKSHIISPLPDDFVAYLHADGIFLPNEVNTSGEYDVDSDSDSDTNAADDDDGNDGNDAEADAPSFPELESRITAAIARLGGAVFPKLNWSSPQDAVWITFANTLKCTTPADIFLLLKASDFVAHDLSHAYEGCVDMANVPAGHDRHQPATVDLVLREWYDLAPSMLFRCFVRHGVLVAISQRDTANYYEFLRLNRDDICADVVRFFDTKISGKFPDPCYVFDVYMNARTRRVWLLDFNPWGPSTDTMLFTWDEILDDGAAGLDADVEAVPRVELRIIESLAEAQGGAAPAFAHNRLPKEVFDLSDGASISEFASKFQREILLAQTSGDD